MTRIEGAIACIAITGALLSAPAEKMLHSRVAVLPSAVASRVICKLETRLAQRGPAVAPSRVQVAIVPPTVDVVALPEPPTPATLAAAPSAAQLATCRSAARQIASHVAAIRKSALEQHARAEAMRARELARAHIVYSRSEDSTL